MKSLKNNEIISTDCDNCTSTDASATISHPQPVAKSKPQVIVPLQGPSASAHAPLSKIQQLQQKASMLTAVLKGGQAFISSSSSSSTQRKVLTLLPPHTHPPSNHPTPVQNGKS